MLNGRAQGRRANTTPTKQKNGHGDSHAFMSQLRDHVRRHGPLLGSRSDDFLKQLPDDVHHPRPLKRHIQQQAASYGMRFEDRQPPDGWVVELVPDGRQSSDEQTICTALAAWILSRNDKRMRSGEIDQFYIQHKSLPRKKGVSWLNDDLLEKYGLRRHIPKGDKSFFYIEAIPKSVTPKPLNSPWSLVAAGAKTEPPLGSDPVYDPTSARRPIGAIGAPRIDHEAERREAFLAEQRRLQAQAQAERELLLQREREEAERRRVAQAQSEEASLALARRLMAEDAAALGQRAEPEFQSVSSQPKQRAARQEEASASSSAFDPVPSVHVARRRTDAFVSSHGVDASACAALRALPPLEQVRLVRRLEKGRSADGFQNWSCARTQRHQKARQLRGAGEGAEDARAGAL